MITIPSDFPWRPGMRLLSADGAARVLAVEDGMPTVLAVEGPIRMDRSVGCYVEAWSDDAYHESDRPDIEDAATVGGLLGAVREAYHDPSMYTGPTTMLRMDGTAPRWFVYTGAGKGPLGDGNTEAEALIAAWNARPERSA